MKNTLGLIGSICLCIGVFMPILSVPVVGDKDYFQNGEGDGSIVLVLGALSLIFVLAKKYKPLWFTGLGSLVVITFSFISVQDYLSKMKADVNSKLAGNPFRGLADLALQSIQLQWGWALLFIGAVLVIASAASKDETQ